MQDITTPLVSLCTIAVFGTILIAWPARRLAQIISSAAFGVMLLLFIRKYFFASPVMAPIGRDLAFLLGIATILPAVAVCFLAARKLRRQERVPQAGEQ